MSLLPKSIHRCRRYPTKFNSGRDIPGVDGEARKRPSRGQHDDYAERVLLLYTA